MHDILQKPADLVERLGALHSLAAIPRGELEWLAANGELRHYEQGAANLRKGDEVVDFVIVLSGRLVVSLEHATGHRHTIESKAGSLTGVLPYSRIGRALGDVVMVDAGDVLAIHRDRLPELITQCPVLTTKLVHIMLDRTRTFTGMNWQDEKLLSLGRLAAGLAHELNNPASAAARDAARLAPALSGVGEAAFALGAANLTSEQRGLIEALVARCLAPATTGVWSTMERADREEDIAAWLEAHGADPAPAACLAEYAITTGDLDELAAALGGSGRTLDLAIRWIAEAGTSHELATNLGRAAERIHDLVSAVKRFSYVDRSGAPEPTDVAQGLIDTVALLKAKARAKDVRVTVDVAPGLPKVTANTAALNQVWANLIENALDAVESSGEVAVTAEGDGDAVIVRVVDNGPGIPPEVQERMFDPFFTTKGVGEGSGLGLDIARRVVRTLEGEIHVDTRPGRTEFRVAVPIGR